MKANARLATCHRLGAPLLPPMRASRGQHAALERDSAHLHRALVLNGRVHLMRHADSHRRRQSHDQQTAGNYELVRDEDAESWRRSGSCPNKMSLAAAETFRLPSWLGLTTWSSAALREGKFCHALVSSRFLVAVARAVSSGDQYNPLEH